MKKVLLLLIIVLVCVPVFVYAQHIIVTECLDCHPETGHPNNVNYEEYVNKGRIPLAAPLNSDTVNKVAPLFDGIMTCLTCHDMAGPNYKLLVTPTVNELCVICHIE